MWNREWNKSTSYSSSWVSTVVGHVCEGCWSSSVTQGPRHCFRIQWGYSFLKLIIHSFIYSRLIHLCIDLIILSFVHCWECCLPVFDLIERHQTHWKSPILPPVTVLFASTSSFITVTLFSCGTQLNKRLVRPSLCPFMMIERISVKTRIYDAAFMTMQLWCCIYDAAAAVIIVCVLVIELWVVEGMDGGCMPLLTRPRYCDPASLVFPFYYHQKSGNRRTRKTDTRFVASKSPIKRDPSICLCGTNTEPPCKQAIYAKS